MGDGGAQRTVANLAKGFVERGYEIDLLLLRAEGPYLEELPDEVAVVEMDADRALKSIPELVGYFKETNPDVLFSTMEYLNVTSLISSMLSRTSARIVIRAANVQMLKDKSSIRSKLQLVLARHLYPRADEIIALSEYVRRDITSHYNLERCSISVIYNPVAVEKIQQLSMKGIEHDVFNSKADVIISVGRLSEQKDIATTLRSFALLSNRRDAKLVILGKGEQRDMLVKMAEDLGVSGQVYFFGWVDNPFPYMAAADVFVLSSQWEGFGHVIVEAMACGTPVVATDCPGGPSEILAGGQYGELVPVGDTEALSKAIEQTLVDPPEKATLIDRATDFSYRKIIDQYEETIFGRIT